MSDILTPDEHASMPHDQGLRLDALNFALRFDDGYPADAIVERAKTYLEFLKGDNDNETEGDVIVPGPGGDVVVPDDVPGEWPQQSVATDGFQAETPQANRLEYLDDPF